MPESLRITAILCRLKVRLLINSLKNWASAGKTIGIGISVILTAFFINSGAADVINMLRMLPYAELLLDWLLGGMIVYVIFLVFTGDLLTGHSLNTGQMSTDFNYLQSLPVPPTGLIIVKLFERVITDYLGIIILFSGFLGLACRNGFTFEGLMLAFCLYLEISLLIGLIINLSMIFMTRFFRLTTINNIFSLLSYCSAFLSIVPYLVISNFLPETLDFVVSYLDVLNETVFVYLLPVQWLATSLLSASFCDEFFYFSGFWAACMLIGTIFFSLAIGWNWFNYAHGNNVRQSNYGKRFFRGLYHKEVMLLKGDFNLLINALLMPITLIILEIHFLKEVVSLTTPAAILNIVAGAIIYFCMFGPVNAIGYEGRTISLLEALPLPPQTLLANKSIFWTAIAECIFVPATIASMVKMGFSTGIIIEGTCYVALFTAACVWAAVLISAIFPCFDSKILQQRSTFAGKLAALALMLLLVPAKNLSATSIYSITIFVCIFGLIANKAVNILLFRLDDEARSSQTQKIVDTMIFFLAMAGCEISITHCFTALAPAIDTGMWNWMITAAVFFPASLILLLMNRQPAANDQICSKTGSKLSWLIIPLQTAIILLISNHYFAQHPEIAAEFKSDLAQITDLARAFSVSLPVWKSVLAIMATVFGSALTCLALQGFSGRTIFSSFATIGVIGLAAPHAMIPVALLTAAGIAATSRLTGKRRDGIALGALVSAGLAIFIIFF